MEKQPNLKIEGQQLPEDHPIFNEGVTFEEAETLFGEDFFGPRAVEQVFGTKPETVPDIPFSKAELIRAKELGQQLILQVDTMTHEVGGITSRKKVVPLTLENLKQKLRYAYDGGRFSYVGEWYPDEDFFEKEKPRTGWRLTSKEVISGSTGGDYLEQTDILIDHLQNQVFKDSKLPRQYEDAIAEFKGKRAEIKHLLESRTESEWQKGSQMLVDLAITKLVRELSVEVMYRRIVNDKNIEHNEPLPTTDEPATWTASSHSFGYLVNVSCVTDRGAYVGGQHPLHRINYIGTSFSRG